MSFSDFRRVPLAPPQEAQRLLEYNVSDLHFDTENPRLPEAVDRGDDVAVVEWMLTDGTLLDLMGSIAEHGYFSGEPMILVPREKGGWTVVEGNRRLAALRLLANPESAPVRKASVLEMAETATYRPAVITAIEFSDRNQTLDYLGFRHITGVKEWDPLAKARYLRQLWDRTPGDRGPKLREMARKIGSQPYYVSRLLGGLRVFDEIDREHYYDIPRLNDQSLSFSLLSTALSYRSLAEYMQVTDDPDASAPLEKQNVERVTRWFYEQLPPDGRTVLGESRNLKVLAAVIGRPEARARLEEGATLADAALETEYPAQQLTRTLRQARDRLDSAVRLMRRVPTPSEADTNLLNDISLAAEDMLAIARNRSRRREDHG